MGGLPAGLTVRPIEASDFETVTGLMGTYTAELLGFPKYSLEDVANYLRDPAVDLAADTWLVFDGPEPIGCGTAARHGNRIELDVTATDPALAAWLLDATNHRADQRAAEIDRARAQSDAAGTDPAGDVTVGLGILRDDKLLPELAAARGFEVGTTVQRMEIRFAGPVEAPAVPAGAVLRRGAPDDASRRTAHRLITEAFADQPTAVPPSYDEWLATRESRSTFDWSQLTVLELDGRPVAVRECNDNFVSSENCGYVGRLAVLASARGHGLAKFLLHDAFALDATAGRSGTILHVDTANPTPAVQLYLGVGMRPRVVTDIWRRTVGRV